MPRQGSNVPLIPSYECGFAKVGCWRCEVGIPSVENNCVEKFG